LVLGDELSSHGLPLHLGQPLCHVLVLNVMLLVLLLVLLQERLLMCHGMLEGRCAWDSRLLFWYRRACWRGPPGHG
jgi:hypothetical protein